MSLQQRLTQELEDFEEKTEGILGSCVIATQSALMLAEASSTFDTDVIQAMSERFLKLATETLNFLLESSKLEAITIEETDHYMYVRKVNAEYHLVVLSDRSETVGLRELNVKALIKSLQVIF